MFYLQMNSNNKENREIISEIIVIAASVFIFHLYIVNIATYWNII